MPPAVRRRLARWGRIGRRGGPPSDRRGHGRSNEDYGFGPGGDIPLDRIGIQVFTVRDLLADNELDMPGTFEVLRDAGYAELEFGGDYDGRTPTEARRLAESYGLRVASNHFGPRTLIQNTWYDPAERARFFEEAHALGLEAIGTGHSYIAPRTVEGYREMAAAFNVWGQDAVRNGFRYFFFHNHDVEFTIVNGRPLFDILLEETDPRYVKFELDLGWMSVAGADPYEYIRRDPEPVPDVPRQGHPLGSRTGRGWRQPAPRTPAGGSSSPTSARA